MELFTAAGCGPQILPDAYVLRWVRLATLADGTRSLGLVPDGALVVRHGRIAYAGPDAELPGEVLTGLPAFDLEGRWVTPTMLDCHTHPVHGGERSREFEMRLEGAS